jgi:DNA-binding transcriptional ArsR family regulator
VDQKTAISMFAALGQETRFSAFMLLKQEPNGLPSGEIAQRLDVPQNTMSVHMGILARAGLVSAQRWSRSIIYRAEPSAATAVDNFLKAA